MFALCRWPQQAMRLSVLLRRERWQIDRAHGGRDLVSVWRGHVGARRNRRIQFSSSGGTAGCRLEPHQELIEEDLEQV